MTRTEVLELASRSKSISSYNARRPRFIYFETGTPKQPDSERYTKVAFADCVGIIEKIGIVGGYPAYRIASSAVEPWRKDGVFGELAANRVGVFEDRARARESGKRAMDDPREENQERKHQIANLLLANRGKGTDWGEWQTEGKPWSKRMANYFLLGSALDWRIPSELAWQNAERLVKEILGDPDDLWQAITSVSHSEWKSKHDKYKLHWLHAAHDRLWRIGKRICDEYSGDARRIWEGKNSSAALEALWDVGAGQQISRMIVGALRDCGQIQSRKSDVKGDTYVRHVLGRAVLGETTDAERAVKLAGQMHAEDPWQLDAQLWEVGKKWCHPNNPNCSQCYLAPHCAYAISRT